MKATLRILPAIMLVGLLLLSSGASAQEQIRILNYNILNFPTGDIEDREDTLKVIIDYVQPDLILLQELKSPFGLNVVANVSCADLDGIYLPSTYVAQQSNPGTTNPLQQGIVYNSSVFGLSYEGVVITPYRDVNEYILYLTNEGLAQGDTTFLYVYTTHLKSSQGSDNEALRLQMVDAWREHLDSNVPSDAYVFIGGDFNVYSSSEPAYEELLSSDNLHQFVDPIDAPGEWHDASFPQKEILTQSTRVQSIFGDGAGGGLDDRFDFILLNDHMIDPSSDLHYVDGSYHALGNNGTCYDQNIINCDLDNTVPYEILQALYYMSDHLPVVLDLESTQALAITENQTPKVSIFPIPSTGNIVINSDQTDRPRVLVRNIEGVLVHETVMASSSIDLSQLSDGIYLLEIQFEAGSTIRKIFLAN